jgi:hypothetical protein
MASGCCAGDLLDVHPALRADHQHIALQRAVNRDADVVFAGDFDGFLDQHLLGDQPCGFWGETSRLPRMLSAAWAASSGVLASLMPPALPRPPISTCALTTTGVPSRSATAFASAGVRTTSPCGVGTPNSRRICFAWLLV